MRRFIESELDTIVTAAFMKDGDLLEKWIEEDNDYEPTEKEKAALYQRIMDRIYGTKT